MVVFIVVLRPLFKEVFMVAFLGLGLTAVLIAVFRPGFIALVIPGAI